MALGLRPISSAPLSSPPRAPTFFSWRNQLVALDLVTRIYREDGTTVEIVDERRGMVKALKRRKNVLELEVVDVDRSALESLIPSKRYTVADFPKLFVDHVGRSVPQVVGTALKVPLTYVDNTPGAYRYLACEVLGATPSVLTVYRNERVVAAAEYALDTVAVAGTTYLRVTFAKEQADFNGSLYSLTADILGPGSRAASDEVKRILALLGASTDASSFAAAALYCNEQRMLADCPYVEPRQGIAIIQDLLQIARAQLTKTPAGTLGIFIDRPRDVHVALDDSPDELEVEDYGQPDLVKTLTIEYRPSSSQGEKFTGKLTRTTDGAVGERIYRNPYIRDHDVADRLLSYLQKRENARAEAHASVHGVQFATGELVAVRSEVSWTGWKVFAAPQIARPADRNQVTLREYVEAIYAYSAGTLPAEATNTYLPDYSQTPPAAPTGLQVVSQSTLADNDGKVTAYALVRAVPPAVNWARLIAQARDTTTNEIYQVQLLLSAGNYEATIAGLRPNRTHELKCWAVNATNVDGAVATLSPNFTSANYTTQPNAPGSIASQQQSPRQVLVTWGRISDVAGQPKIRRYVIFKKTGGGSFVEVDRVEATVWVDDNVVIDGTQYQYKVRSEDMVGNESNDSSTSTITPAKVIDDAYIIGAGVSGVSIANSSINQSRTSTSTGSTSGTAGAGGTTQIQASTTDGYTMFWAVICSTQFVTMAGRIPWGTNAIAFTNDTGSNQNYSAAYRAIAA